MKALTFLYTYPSNVRVPSEWNKLWVVTRYLFFNEDVEAVILGVDDDWDTVLVDEVWEVEDWVGTLTEVLTDEVPWEFEELEVDWDDCDDCDDWDEVVCDEVAEDGTLTAGLSCDILWDEPEPEVELDWEEDVEDELELEGTLTAGLRDGDVELWEVVVVVILVAGFVVPWFEVVWVVVVLVVVCEVEGTIVLYVVWVF